LDIKRARLDLRTSEKAVNVQTITLKNLQKACSTVAQDHLRRKYKEMRAGSGLLCRTKGL